MALITLQGLVNRSQPRLYLLLNATDGFWLDRMKERGWIRRIETVTWLDS